MRNEIKPGRKPCLIKAIAYASWVDAGPGKLVAIAKISTNVSAEIHFNESTNKS